MTYFVIAYCQNLEGAFNSLITTYDDEITARTNMYSQLSDIISSEEYLSAIVQVANLNGQIIYEVSWPDIIN